MTTTEPDVPLQLGGAALRYGPRPVWSGLDLTLNRGEFLAVLGGNGSGKTSLLKAALGLHPLAAGTIRVNGTGPDRGRRRVGYVPQQRQPDPLTPLRARDLVRMGLDGHRWGPGVGRGRAAAVGAALRSVGAAEESEQQVSRLSGGQQQLVRIAQALVCDPALLLCDEPLASLDLHYQRLVSALIERRRREHDTAVVFVTHDINPVLPYVDRVLYLAGGRFRVGTVEEVLTSAGLSGLYRAPVEVLRVGDRIVVTGVPDATDHAPERDDLVGPDRGRQARAS